MSLEAALSCPFPADFYISFLNVEKLNKYTGFGPQYESILIPGPFSKLWQALDFVVTFFIGDLDISILRVFIVSWNLLVCSWAVVDLDANSGPHDWRDLVKHVIFKSISCDSCVKLSFNLSLGMAVKPKHRLYNQCPIYVDPEVQIWISCEINVRGKAAINLYIVMLGFWDIPNWNLWFGRKYKEDNTLTWIFHHMQWVIFCLWDDWKHRLS